MTTTSRSPIILIAGHWLGAWAWDEVLHHLDATGSSTLALTLPGLDPNDPARATKTLGDQVAAIEDAIARLDISAEQPAVVAAHSGANAPVTLLLDRHPELIGRVVWVDSGPMASGSAFAADLPEELQDFPLPPFDALGKQASLDGLTAEALERFRSRAVPEPAPVLREALELSNDARRKVPTTLVCCSMPGSQVLDLARGGHPMFAEVADLEDVTVVELPTGHWPMWSRPGDLADIIRAAATRQA